MTGEHLNAQARRVISGLDPDGKSTIVTDENTATRIASAPRTVCDLWRLDSLPAHIGDNDTLTGEVEIYPPKSGLVVRVTTFPPDSELDPATAYRELPYSDIDDNDSGIAGLHVTDTVDVVTVLSGELYAVLESAETLLRPGDTFIQRGTRHAWSNRSDKPAIVVAVMMAAKC